MADTPLWVTVGLPIFTFVSGFGGSLSIEELRERRSGRREASRLRAEAEARAEERAALREEARAAFQRETMLELQEAAQKLLRSSLQITRADQARFETNGEWPPRPVGGAVPEDARLQAGRVHLLKSRVHDASIRESIDSLMDLYVRVVRPKTAKGQAAALQRMAELLDQANERVGQLVRDP